MRKGVHSHIFFKQLVEQFQKLRDGDRFWYENPGVFKPEQLTQIKQSSLGRVICDSSDDIQDITKDVFRLPKHQSPTYVTCGQIPRVELRFWAECCHGKYQIKYRFMASF